MDEINLNVFASVESFWKASKIYFEHPNSINRQVLLSEIIICAKSQLSLHEEDGDKLYKYICDNLIECPNKLELKNLLQSHWIILNDVSEVFESFSDTYIILRKLIPKKTIDIRDYYEFLVLNKEKAKILLYTKHVDKRKIDTFKTLANQDPLTILKFEYLEVVYGSSELKLLFSQNSSDKTIQWLKAIFLPKFAHLISTVYASNGYRNNSSNSSEKLCFTSKVDLKKYYTLYDNLKSKYAANLIKNWMEKTDPKKFVYEDIAIAAYLILLWESKNLCRGKKQKFIDLGCGNGLLVHILNSEGHLGIGLDMRKRKIWDSYSTLDSLREEIINPLNNTTHPKVDWLIGNHSDELTPWIPIMARKNNENCQYFVLPCCPYELNGKKFQRRNSSLSSYHDFINYVKSISELCDFETFIDKLRIPSTKRICLIGFCKAYMPEKNMNLVNEKIESFIKDNLNIDNSSKENGWKSTLISFKVRENMERVRNCTKLQQNVISEILISVMSVLLRSECKIEVIKNNSPCTWNRGGEVMIGKLAKEIDRNLMKKLKEECKGLQTLLKNHHYLFDVSKGCVQYRSPESLKKISNSLLQYKDKFKWKERNCWFYNNHPDGCPLSDQLCCYKHILIK